jgi:hypothetical protein
MASACTDVVQAEGQKLVVAWPLYRQVSVSWLFNYQTMNKQHVAAVVGTEAIYITMAMNQLVNMAFEQCPDFDRIVFMEHDMIPPQNGFDRIAQYGPEHDIVGTTYFKHDYPHHVMAWMQVDPPFYSPLTAEVVRYMFENQALYEVDAVAMGFTAIKREVFEQWDRTIPVWEPPPPEPGERGLVGHDLWFCNAAKKQGFKVFLDSGIGSGHLTLLPIGYGHSQGALAASPPPRWSDDGTAKFDGAFDTYREHDKDK